MYQVLFHTLEYSGEEIDKYPCPHKISILAEETKHKHDKITYGTLEENEC